MQKNIWVLPTGKWKGGSQFLIFYLINKALKIVINIESYRTKRQTKTYISNIFVVLNKISRDYVNVWGDWSHVPFWETIIFYCKSYEKLNDLFEIRGCHPNLKRVLPTWRLT